MKSTTADCRTFLNLTVCFRLALQNPDDQCHPAASGRRSASPSQGEMVEENERRRPVRGEREGCQSGNSILSSQLCLKSQLNSGS